MCVCVFQLRDGFKTGLKGAMETYAEDEEKQKAVDGIQRTVGVISKSYRLPAGYRSVGRSVDPSVGRSVGRSVGPSVGPGFGGSIGEWIGRSVGGSVVRHSAGG